LSFCFFSDKINIIMFTLVEKQFILDLAHKSIEQYFYTGELLKIPEAEIPEKFQTEQSCFVTLELNKELRGCIGHIKPVQPLYLDIIENAVDAAFDDPRFLPLTEEEFTETKIEVSVLTVPVELSFSSPEDLLNKLRPNIDGVIIRRADRGATYLPQVWEEIPDKEKFLSELCLKAELLTDDWHKHDLRVWVYQVEVIK
jgi:uncharacterized protein